MPTDAEAPPRGPPLALEIAVYVAFALASVWRALGDPDRLVGDGVDLYGTIWFYWWIADCLANFRDPSWTDLFFYPQGKDIFAHTGNNFVDAVVAAPLVWLVGSPGYYRLWIPLVIVVNALAFRPLARDQIGDPWAAFGATLLWISNPFVLFELLCGRPTQGFLWFLPLAVLWLLHVDRSVRTAVACGIAFALVGWTYWFNGYFLAFASMWIAAWELARRDREARLRWLRNAGIAAVVAAAGVAPGVVAMWHRASRGDLPGTASTSDWWTSMRDAATFGPDPGLHGYALWESSGPVFFHHLPWAILLVATVAVAWGGDDRAIARRWVGVLAVALLVAMGTTVDVGEMQFRFWPYVILRAAVPFMDRLWFPYRALVLAFLAVSIGGGLLLAWVGRVARARGWPAPRAIAGTTAALVVGTLISEWRDDVWPFPARAVPLPTAYAWMATEGGAILDLPRGIAQNFIVHQTRHRRPLFGGMGENVPLFWPPGYRERTRNGFVTAVSKAAREPLESRRYKPSDRERFVDDGFRWVLLHRDLVESEFNRRAIQLPPERFDEAPFLVQDRLIELLGAPTAADGPLVVWALVPPSSPPPEAIVPRADTLRERTWDTPEPLAYEVRLYELGRLR